MEYYKTMASLPLCCPSRRQGGGAPARMLAFPNGPQEDAGKRNLVH